MWAILMAPMLLGADVRQLTPFDLELRLIWSWFAQKEKGEREGERESEREFDRVGQQTLGT